MCDEVWEKIIKTHQYGKSLMLLAEEFDRESSIFLQPSLEHRNALEHIIRARAGQLDLHPKKDTDNDYINSNLEKALGHEYRAFFDIADWISVRIREKIQDLLTPYANDCILAVIPNYYTETRQAIEKINKDIAGIRAEKDISHTADILREVEHYNGQISRLLKIYEELLQEIPALEEWRKKDRRYNYKTWTLKILAAIIVAAISSIVTWIVAHNPSV